MLASIDHLISTENLAKIRELLQASPFVDGKLSAGMVARDVKHNQEMNPQSEHFNTLNELVMGNLVRHPKFKAAAWPKKVAAPFYAKYEPGMAYGEHVDDPVMGQGELYRTDISTTVFLSNPDEYDGGELTIRDTYGERKIKLAAGSAVIYPSHSRHYVAPVTRGTRYVAVTWAQSTIRDPAQREMLYELNQAREMLFKEQPDAESTRKVSAVFNNLVRRWIDI
ncbi:MAG: Fe2+-dependent dioxygenase [Gammaproteobacteria bacterium]|nr:Fe2+-dependent dioxygenase [Gammaproteobacteria bacterium]